LPSTYINSYPATSNWTTALAALDAYDPHRLFAAPLHDILMP